MPGAGNAVARGLGLTGGRALATSTVVNAAVGAGFSWGTNQVHCRPTDPWDLLIGAAGGASSSLIGPAFSWLKGLFGKASGFGPGAATRGAPGFTAGSNGDITDVREIGRPDNDLVLSGHGGLLVGDGSSVTVPPGTRVYMYSGHGEEILDWDGHMIEVGVRKKSAATEIFESGEKLPDYLLLPPDDLSIAGRPRNVTVTRPTWLSELLRLNMGSVHWAACRGVYEEMNGR
ncbi:putative adhesin [Streptomyces mirabilis]|uniref:putative adhesin n=1 Tax=Streptomyces mirabilis TaxID=68239 RepID=UPI0036432F6E